MSKRKTKRQKRQAKKRRQQEVLRAQSLKTSSPPEALVVKSAEKKKGKQIESGPSIEERNTKYLIKDLTRTLVITGLIAAILTTLFLTQSQWLPLLP